MSTRDALLIPDPSRLPEALREPLEGVSLAAYLFVEAGRLDALPLSALLAWLGVRESAFERAEERWNDRVSDELTREGPPFDVVYEDLISRALSLWGRAITPLDHDVESWMMFQRHALAAPDPGGMARGLGLTAGDELRLTRSWRPRLQAPEIAARAVAAMTAPLAPLPALSLAPLVFPPRLEPA